MLRATLWLALSLFRSECRDVDPIVAALVAQGGNAQYAEAVACAVDQYADSLDLSPALLVGVIGVENRELDPRARSSAGAMGIMQVMPHWKRDLRSCGTDLTDIRTNVCYGARILKLELAHAATLKGALLRYVGCVHSDCRAYVRTVTAKIANAERVLQRTFATALEADSLP